jgi:cytochrome c-type biogenesis protein CcmH/NrfG
MLALAALLPMLPTLRGAFVYDDTTIIRDNATLRGWAALARVWSEPYWPHNGADVSGLYRPLHVAVLSAVWNASGGSPTSFHLYALALYFLVVVLVWRLLRAGSSLSATAVGTFWFATNPLHVEAVASVANSSELLVVAFTIALTILVRGGDGDVGAVRGWRDGFLAALLTAAAVLSKESGLFALPLAALTAWGWRRNAAARDDRRFIRNNARLWLGGVAAIVVVLLARAVVLGAPVSRVAIAAPGLDRLSPGDRLAAMLSLWPRIAGMLLWPSDLSPYYGPTILPLHRAALAGVAALVAIAVIVWTTLVARRGERRPLVALGWVVLTYLPAANLITATGQLLADRTLFGATVGVALALAVAVDRAPRPIARVLVTLAVVATLRDALESARYSAAWSSHRTLWARLVETSPAEYRGYELLGIDARERGDTTRALALLSRAYAMEPGDRRARFEYGQVLYATGRYSAAVQILAPLLRDGDARSEAGFVAMFLDAVGRSRGAAGVVAAGTPLLRGEAAATAALFVGAAEEQLGRPAVADSIYGLGLSRAPDDTILRTRRTLVRHRDLP